MLGGTTAQEGDIFVVAEELLTVGIAVPGVTEEVSDIVTKVISFHVDLTLYFSKTCAHSIITLGDFYLPSEHCRIGPFARGPSHMAIPISRYWCPLQFPSTRNN